MSVGPGLETELVRALKKGLPRAYETLLQDYGDRIYRFVRRMVGAAHAEEIVQDVFYRVFCRIGRYEPKGSFQAWVFAIANNLCIDHLRRKAVVRRQALDDVEDALESPGESYEGELREAIVRAIQELPTEQKQIFLLREEGGLAFREIADLLRCPLNTALGRMHDAVERLRKALEAYR